ncbi:UNVERIFIED_CONTAM: hypothetical protein RKD50_006763 [Streptomyces canus]
MAAPALAGCAVLLLRPAGRRRRPPPGAGLACRHLRRACLLTSADTDPGGRAALRQTADAHLVVQGYRQTAAADPVAYVDALVQLRCSTVATTGKEARSAAASRPAKGKVTGVRFVVVADRPARRSGPAEPCDGQRAPWSDRCAAERPRLSTGGDGLRGAPTLEP